MPDKSIATVQKAAALADPWLIVERPNGDWQIAAVDEARRGRILFTFLTYASAQNVLAEYHAGLWNAVIPF